MSNNVAAATSGARPKRAAAAKCIDNLREVARDLKAPYARDVALIQTGANKGASTGAKRALKVALASPPGDGRFHVKDAELCPAPAGLQRAKTGWMARSWMTPKLALQCKNDEEDGRPPAKRMRGSPLATLYQPNVAKEYVSEVEVNVAETLATFPYSWVSFTAAHKTYLAKAGMSAYYVSEGYADWPMMQ